MKPEPSPAEILAQIQRGTYEGFATDLSDDHYNSDRLYFRNSWNGEIGRSPAHLRYAIDHPKDSEAFSFGRALHYRLQSADAFKAHVYICPKVDGRTKEGKAARAKFEVEGAGKTCISDEERDRIEEIAGKLERDNDIAPILRGGQAEVAGFFKEPLTQVACKFKLDLWRPDKNVIVDFKSADNVSHLDDIEKKIYNFGYYTQAALYTMGTALLTGKPAPDFVCCFLEKNPPFEFRFVRINEAAIDAGLKVWRDNLATYKRCVRDNHWPGYPRRIEDASLPAWGFNRV